MGDLGTEQSPTGGGAHLDLRESIHNPWHFEVVNKDDTISCKRRKGTEKDRQREAKGKL